MKKESKKVVIGTIIFIVVFAVALGVALFVYNRLSESILPEQFFLVRGEDGEIVPLPAADFTVIDREGEEVHFANQLAQGRPIVLNFWASWCPPCRAGMPDFNRGYQQFGDEVIFMMVNLTDGRRETKEGAIGYIDEEGYSFPIYFDTEASASEAYIVQRIPITFFINREGNVVNVIMGQMSEAVLREEIERIK